MCGGREAAKGGSHPSPKQNNNNSRPLQEPGRPGAWTVSHRNSQRRGVCSWWTSAAAPFTFAASSACSSETFSGVPGAEGWAAPSPGLHSPPDPPSEGLEAPCVPGCVRPLTPTYAPGLAQLCFPEPKSAGRAWRPLGSRALASLLGLEQAWQGQGWRTPLRPLLHLVSSQRCRAARARVWATGS